MKRNLSPMGVVALLLALSPLPAAARAAQQERPEPPKIIRKSGGVLQGSATRRVEPAYPPLAKTAQVSGAVVVEVTVDEEGNVISARAISGHPLLKDSAVNAARGWKFTPTQLSGVPVKVIGTITFNFTLDFSKEIESLKQQIAEHPNNSDLYLSLGSLYVETQQLEDAMGAYRQALAVKPDNAHAQFAIGRLLERQGRSEEASQIYLQIIAGNLLSSLNEYQCHLMGKALYETSHHREAVEALTQAIKEDADDEETYMLLGMAYLKLGDKPAAMKQYEALKEREPALAKELLERINRQ